MIPQSFRYHRAETVDEALRLLRQEPDAKILAGGHSLLPLMKLRLARPRLVIDIGRIAELSRVEVSRDRVVLGAMARYYQVASHEALAQVAPIMREAIAVIADPQVRHRGTVGGSAVHADPTADLAAVFLATDAEFVVRGSQGERRIAAQEWYVAPMMAALGADEMLCRIEWPLPLPAQQGYLKFPHPASGYALAGVAVLLSRAADGRVDAVHVAVTGAGDLPFRAESAEKALAGQWLEPRVIAAAAEQGAADGQYRDDGPYSAAYRQNLVRVMIQRALLKVSESST
ncbi:MAG: xanthine dehydrogenase family protein subunit M [Firmicutes bacterium]|nr:xanthine dehydrogenase family protein subunit M [Bacillota bacterium]